jgi:hypothetical protein
MFLSHLRRHRLDFILTFVRVYILLIEGKVWLLLIQNLTLCELSSILMAIILRSLPSMKYDIEPWTFKESRLVHTRM